MFSKFPGDYQLKIPSDMNDIIQDANQSLDIRFYDLATERKIIVPSNTKVEDSV